jgi:hypothetical protein
MVDISYTITFCCLAASALAIRFLPNDRLFFRLIPLMLIVPAIYFGFNRFEVHLPKYVKFAVSMLAVSVLIIDGFLKFNGDRSTRKNG